MTTAPRIEVHEDAAELATAVAGELLSRLVDAQASGRIPHLGLTGGTIAEAIHREIARLSPGSEVDWTRVVVWWGDERFVAPASSDRNDVDARAAFLDVVGVPAEHRHPMPSTDDAPDVDAAAASYAGELREHGSGTFDILMLGMGPDGHVASLFPGHPGLDVTDTMAIGVTGSPKPPPERVSLTFEALNRSASVWFLVSGEGKAEAVARAHSGTPDSPVDRHDIPATGVSGQDETIWFLDRASASLL
jgi:6-phosphogluconolactonase